MISKQFIPNGGWTFNEDSIPFKAQTFDGLCKVVAEYRQANGKEAGNPSKEVEAQIEARVPSLTINKINSMPPSLKDKAQSFAQALLNYLKNGGELVDQNTANVRSEICSSCHNNKADGKSSGCGPCQKMADKGVDFIRASVLHGRAASAAGKLKSCFLCGCDLKMKVWFPTSYFDPSGSEKNKWPTFCWMKK